MRQDFARLMLGIFATSFPSYPLTFKYAAQGEAPEGKADTLDVTGPANFATRLVVQRDTHLPVVLMWQVPATNVIVRVYSGTLTSPFFGKPTAVSGMRKSDVGVGLNF